MTALLSPALSSLGGRRGRRPRVEPNKLHFFLVYVISITLDFVPKATS